MPTLTDEGRALALEVRALDEELGARMSRWLNAMAALEEYADEQIAQAMADELARAEPAGNVLAWRVRGGMA